MQSSTIRAIQVPMCRRCLLFMTTLFAVVACDWDARRMAPHCIALSPVLQRGCQGCCAAAVAAAAGARSCARTNVSVAFSMQRVWDCAQVTRSEILDCEYGVDPSAFLPSLLTSDGTDRVVFSPVSKSTQVVDILVANSSRCTAVGGGYELTEMRYTTTQTRVGSPVGDSMREEIEAHGPVVRVRVCLYQKHIFV